MNTRFTKKLWFKIAIIISFISVILLFPDRLKTANSNSLAQIPPFGNPPPNLLKPPKPQILPSPAATPAQFRGQIVYQASISDSKVIALTFDDGPTAETLKILKILQKHNAVATFFCLGANLREYPEIAKQVVKAGNAIGNHTWHHFYHNVTEKIASDEIDNTGVHIYRSTGAKSLLFRPPGGRLNNGFADYAKKKNYVVVMWSIDPKDFSQPPAAAIARTVLSQATSGAIVLLHDGGGDRQQTVEAVSAIIPKLKQQGYRFVTVPQLLEMQAAQKQEKGDRKSQ
ncbi:MAG: polysaccharide deacetylase family protein [Oscillatoriales cyanobacterium]|nr:MAG: polysaccharide deacetylase family protein [Oscillatoriales cyanobacterium]